MDDESLKLRREIRGSNDKAILLTPEIVDNIPFYLAHFEILDNQIMLKTILYSLKNAEPYGIFVYLYQIVFGERDSTLLSCQQNIIEGLAQTFLNETISLPSFPYQTFSNVKYVTELMQFLSPFNKKRSCAINFLVKIFERNQKRSFIPLSIYQDLFELIAEDKELYQLLISILLNSAELPKDIFQYISPILDNLFQSKDIGISRIALFILYELHVANIPFDTSLILLCENLFIGSLDELIILQLTLLIRYAPEPPYQHLERILDLIGSLNTQVVKNSFEILKVFGTYWNGEQKDLISERIMSFWDKYMSLEGKTFFFITSTLDVLLIIDRLPVGNIDFLSKIVEMANAYHNPTVLTAVYTILENTKKVLPDLEKQMLMIIKSSHNFEYLAQDRNADVSIVAQAILNRIETIDFDT